MSKIKFLNLGGKYLIHIILIVTELFGFYYLGESLFHLSNFPIWGMFIYWSIALYFSDRIAHLIVQEE